MVKVDFCMIVHNGQPFCSLNLEAIYPLANRVIIVEGPVSIYRNMGYGHSNDGTLEAIQSFPDPDKKIRLVSRLDWGEKDDMVKAQEPYFDGDFVWAVDADEFYQPDDMLRVFEYISIHDNVYSMSFRLNSFFGGFNHIIGGFEANFEVHRIQKLSKNAHWLTHRPPSMIWTPTGKTCREMGHMDGTKELGVRIFHMSHLPPLRMKHKAKYYQQYSSSIICNYFEQLYLPWLIGTPEQRQVIEVKFQGVQEFRPECRTPAYTVPFSGKLPEIIEKNRFQIETQIQQELKELGVK